MNCQALVATLGSIPNDNTKNTTLGTIVKLVTSVKWSDISQIIGCYSNDNCKVEAVRLIVTNVKNLGSVTSCLTDIMSNFSNDNCKVKTIEIIMASIPSDEVSFSVSPHLKNIISHISNDSCKTSAIGLLVPLMGDTRGAIIPQIFSVMSNDSLKIKALSCIITKIKGVDDNDVLDALSNISSDSNKVECIRLVIDQLGITIDTLLKILRSISSDNSTLVVLQMFIKNGLKTNPTRLLEFCETVSSHRVRADIVVSFDSLTEPIADPENYCQRLATTIKDQDQYLRAAKKLGLDEAFVEKYKPEKISISSFVGLNGVVDQESLRQKGIYPVSHRFVQRDGLTEEEITYSDGTYVKNVRTGTFVGANLYNIDYSNK